VNARLLVPFACVLAAVALVAVGGERAGAPTPPPSALPWRRMAMGTEPVPSASERAAILYVSATCPHCEGVATYADSVMRSHGRRLLVVSADTDSAMRAWRARTGVRAVVVRDSARAMKRALNVRFVPLLVAWNTNGGARSATGDDRVAVRRALEATR
jgi:hypothetical protein